MKRTVVALGFVFLAAAVGVAAFQARRSWRGFRGASGPVAPLANTDGERRVLAVLNEIENSGRTYMSVGEAEGRMLRLLTEAANAQKVVELGTSTGYSGLWFCLALQRTGGTLTTFEIDRERAAMAREHFKNAGVDKLVTVVEGDAHRNISQVRGPLDVVFIDADKEGYVDYLNKLMPLVRLGGMILADNVEMSPDYYRAVTTNPALETVFYSDGEGLGITLKKR